MLHVTPQERHAAQRALERLGVPLSDDLKHRLVREIKRSSRRRPRRGHNDLTAYRLHHDKRTGRERWRVTIDIGGCTNEFHVIYGVRDEMIITFLPPVAEYRVNRSKEIQ